MADTPVPLFSLAALLRGADQKRFRECVTGSGVFYLTDCGVTDQDHQAAREMALDFFERGTATAKQAVSTAVSTMRRGYSALEAESTAQVTSTGDYTDYSMSFSMGSTGNLFPSLEFETLWTAYYDRLCGAARNTARVVLNSTGTYDGEDLETLLDCDPVLRLRYFPEVPEHRVAELEPRRMAPHYDLSIITLIHQTPCANGFVSLHVDVGGESVGLPAVPDTVIGLGGAVAPLVTGGAVPAPGHYVAAPDAARRVGSDRTSSVLFLRPSADFTFSVKQARAYGLDVSLTAESATFGDWIGTNYDTMHALSKP